MDAPCVLHRDSGRYPRLQLSVLPMPSRARSRRLLWSACKCKMIVIIGGVWVGVDYTKDIVSIFELTTASAHRHGFSGGSSMWGKFQATFGLLQQYCRGSPGQAGAVRQSFSSCEAARELSLASPHFAHAHAAPPGAVARTSPGLNRRLAQLSALGSTLAPASLLTAPQPSASAAPPRPQPRRHSQPSRMAHTTSRAPPCPRCP